MDRSRDNFSDYNLLAGGYNVLTSETYGAPLDPPLLLRNGNKGLVTLDELATRFAKAMNDASLPQTERPNLNTWKKVPYLRLDQWRMWTSWDRHSLVPTLLRPAMIESGRVELSFLIDDSPARAGCQPVKGVEKDFFGGPIQTNGVVLPGSFQHLLFEPALADHTDYATPYRGEFEKLKSRKNQNRLLVWPGVANGHE